MKPQLVLSKPPNPQLMKSQVLEARGALPTFHRTFFTHRPRSGRRRPVWRLALGILRLCARSTVPRDVRLALGDDLLIAQRCPTLRAKDCGCFAKKSGVISLFAGEVRWGRRYLLGGEKGLCSRMKHSAYSLVYSGLFPWFGWLGFGCLF